MILMNQDTKNFIKDIMIFITKILIEYIMLVRLKKLQMIIREKL